MVVDVILVIVVAVAVVVVLVDVPITTASRYTGSELPDARGCMKVALQIPTIGIARGNTHLVILRMTLSDFPSFLNLIIFKLPFVD